MHPRPWLARLSFAAFGISCLIGITAALGTRLGAWDYLFGLFVLFPWSIYFGLAAFASGLVWVLWAVIANRGEAARYGLVGVIGSAVLIALPLYDLYQAEVSPAIHDISTDVENPPQFLALAKLRQQQTRDSAKLTPPSYDGPKIATGPDGTASTTVALQKKYYPDIHPRADLTAPDKFFERAVKTAYKLGWHVVAIVPQQGRIEATDTSLWFGFTDDIAIRVRSAGVGARLDIRSKSREDLSAGPFGATDMGRNAAHIRSFLKTLSDTY
jgi:hypothetical protein